MHNYTANIRLGAGHQQKVTVKADTTDNAKRMLEAQYGKGNVSNIMRAS
jgi:hypothetical protein